MGGNALEPNKAQHALWRNTMKGVIKSLTETITPADCVDSTTTGTYTFTGDLPADCIILGWKAVTTVAWDDDTTAVIMLGVSGNTDLYSVTESGSIATTGTVGSVNDTSILLYNAAAASPVATITTASDFTSCVTAGDCSTTVSIYYIELN